GPVRETLPPPRPARVAPRALPTGDRAGGGEDGPAGAAAAQPAPGAPAALTPLQQAVAEAWARALGSPVEHPDADFLAGGGHSLMAMWVVDDLREDLGVELSLAEFFAHPTVAGQALLVERALLAAHGGPHDAVVATATTTDVMDEAR
ncbi:phosphopantetheine-binding protein, partial [Kitasatospora nipponensis]|uniref:phosphopantetheine-binding protein n=1 Tax=Kitasatospora nipponensis TaxID=258049 RepID=UPI0031D610CA